MKTCEISATYETILLLFATKSNAMPREGDQNLRMIGQTLEINVPYFRGKYHQIKKS